MPKKLRLYRMCAFEGLVIRDDESVVSVVSSRASYTVECIHEKKTDDGYENFHYPVVLVVTQEITDDDKGEVIGQ